MAVIIFQLRISEDAKRILTKPPHDRTDKELAYVSTSWLNFDRSGGGGPGALKMVSYRGLQPL